MSVRLAAAVVSLLAQLSLAPLGFAQGRAPRGGGVTPPSGAQPSAQPNEPSRPLIEEKPIVTQHEIHVNGKTLAYHASTGMMPLKNAQGEIEANLFYVAYTLDSVTDLTKRPLMFAF